VTARSPLRAPSTRLGAIVGVGALVAGLAGCGGSGEPPEAGSSAAPAKAEFPPVEGRSLKRLAERIGVTQEIVPSPAGRVFRVGENRFGFGMFTVAREQIRDATVAIYVANGPGRRARGPFPASSESLITKPAFVAETTAADPDAATVVYTSRLRLPARGEWRLLAVFRDGPRLRAAWMPSIVVRAYGRIPAPGDAAPLIHTPTVDDVGDVSEIETRVPPDTMHAVDYADALGVRPVVLLFATPALCQSRVCGPVVDIAEQVKSEYEDEEIAFIHMEVYRDNRIDAGIRPQLKAFGLSTEPWLFVIDASGVVSTAIEGGFGVEDLRRAVDRVLRDG
jgi:hypothetical protein